MGFGRTLTILLFLALLAAVPPAQAQEEEALDRLYFTVQELEARLQTLTAIPPAENDTGSEVQFIQRQDRSYATWRLVALPQDWHTSSAGGQALLFLSGLDDVAPVPPTDDPTAAGREPGSVRIVLTIHNATTTVAKGTAYHDLDPTRSKRTLRLEIDLETEADLVLRGGNRTTADDLFVMMVIHGRHATNVSPIFLHGDSVAHPSALVLPGFPYDALHARDVALREAEECRRILLTGGTCSDEEPPQEEKRDAPSPAFSAVLALALLGALHQSERRSTGRAIADHQRVRSVGHEDV